VSPRSVRGSVAPAPICRPASPIISATWPSPFSARSRRYSSGGAIRLRAREMESAPVTSEHPRPSQARFRGAARRRWRLHFARCPGVSQQPSRHIAAMSSATLFYLFSPSLHSQSFARLRWRTRARALTHPVSAKRLFSSTKQREPEYPRMPIADHSSLRRYDECAR
jgi:hypothetical protein